MIVYIACESLDAKTGLNIFVVVTSKESLADTSPAKPSFGIALTIKYSQRRQDLKYNVIVGAITKGG